MAAGGVREKNVVMDTLWMACFADNFPTHHPLVPPRCQYALRIHPVSEELLNIRHSWVVAELQAVNVSRIDVPI